MITYQAKVNIKNKIIEGDIETSKWILPKREKEDYSERQELTGKDGKDLIVQPVNYANTITTPIQT